MKTSYIIFVLLIILNAGIASCGQDWQQQKDAEAEDELDGKDTDTDGEIDKTGAQVSSTANCTVIVNGVGTVTDEQRKDPDRWMIGHGFMDWHEAMTNAPEGYRLPNRVEVLEAWDAGEFDWVTSNMNVWTSTPHPREGDGWYVGLMNGVSYSTGVEQQMKVIFIKE